MSTKTIWTFSISWVVIIMFLLSADNCSSTQVVPTPLVNYQLACQNLSKLGCPIGLDVKCSVTLQMENEQHLTNIDVDCLTTATTQDAAIGCGGVSCQ